jgi:hypothetical protein
MSHLFLQMILSNIAFVVKEKGMISPLTGRYRLDRINSVKRIVLGKTLASTLTT